MNATNRSRHKLSALVLKALGVFGSIEMLKMLCAVIRTKLVALWIGATGVGVISLYNSTLDMIKSVALLNLRQSSVPAIAGASDEEQQGHICRYVDLLGLIIGIVSTIIVIVLSPLLSFLTFDSYDYAWGFCLLAPTMLATSVGDAKSAIMQGLGRLRTLALSSFYAVVASTAVAIPLFYFFRMAAIVPVLIVFPVFTTLFLMFSPGSKIKRPSYNAVLFKQTVKSLVSLGSFLTVGVSMGFVADYILRVYLNWESGTETVGLFQAGFTIVKSYVGLFFTAITMEFFPRLSSTIHRRKYTSMVVGHEITLSLLMLMPVVVVFIGLNDVLVRLLYSSSFLAVVPYVSIAIIGTLFRAVSWCFSYVIIAKGDGKVYLLTEGVSAVSLLVFSYIGWRCGGFIGLGWAYVAQFVMFTAATWLVCHYRYGLRMPRRMWSVAAAALIISFCGLFLRVAVGWWAALLVLIPAGVMLYIFWRRTG